MYPDQTPNGAVWFWFILFAISATKLHFINRRDVAISGKIVNGLSMA